MNQSATHPPAVARGSATKHGDGDIVDSMRRRIAILRLDLSGLTIITEAATGAYAVTAVIAAMAGARRVHAVARDTAYGSFEDATVATLALAARAGVADRIDVARCPTGDALRACDILTNSGHLRPITRETIAQLPPRAVIALMFEAWEFRDTDLDLAACREHGVRVAAVNERHPDVGVFDFLGPLCVRLLMDAGLDPRGRKVALLCDNPFAPFITAGLDEAGASVSVLERTAAVPRGPWDTVVVALDPSRSAALGDADFSQLAAVAPGARIAQFWGDINRAAAARNGFDPVCPFAEPRKGHMGILLNMLGHEPIVRLQAGGLRAAELAFRGVEPKPDSIVQLV